METQVLFTNVYAGQITRGDKWGSPTSCGTGWGVDPTTITKAHYIDSGYHGGSYLIADEAVSGVAKVVADFLETGKPEGVKALWERYSAEGNTNILQVIVVPGVGAVDLADLREFGENSYSVKGFLPTCLGVLEYLGDWHHCPNPPAQPDWADIYVKVGY